MCTFMRILVQVKKFGKQCNIVTIGCLSNTAFFYYQYSVMALLSVDYYTCGQILLLLYMLCFAMMRWSLRLLKN